MDREKLLYEFCDASSLLDEAVEKGQKGFQVWRKTTAQNRKAKILQLKASLQKREQALGEAIARESGKALWESRIEAKALSQKIDITLEISLPLMESLESFGRIQNESEFQFKPRGLCAVYGPFNFPLHLANGHIIPALLMGNSLLFKPSEFTSLSSQLYADAFEEAGFPEGVFQVLLGGKELGQKMASHPNIDAIFFTGSSEVGRSIVETSVKTHGDFRRLVALELGGKNASIVHQDADLEGAIAACLFSAFASTGQRCTCSSRLFVHSDRVDEFSTKFVKKAQALRYGDPFLEGVFMGPLIHQAAKERTLNRLAEAKADGFVSLLDSVETEKKDSLLSPSVYLASKPELDVKKTALREEFFGPNTIVVPYERTEDLIRWHEATDYGLACSVFSSSRDFFDEIDESLQVGLLNWNRPSVGASSKLPFGGWKRSGNHWPAGSFASLYCAQPRSYVYGPAEIDRAGLPAGIQSLWKED